MKKLFFLYIFVLGCICCFADNGAKISGYVCDGVTLVDLEGTRVTLLRNDSVVGRYTTSKDGLTYNGRCVWYFDIDTDVNGTYSLLFEKEGYDSRLLMVDLKRPLKKREDRFIEDVSMFKAKARVLDEVTVRATKVKFYHKEDTLVYDATAFQTAEGSMLDALIKQLPGVELHDNGEILVNGKKVESLLLNGEPFFKGKNKVMLDNLPSFVVKDIKVYDKRGPMSIATGRDMGDKEYVMDVLLKKEYLIGWLTNIELGAGNEQRYLGRMFALRHTPLSRIALYGNVNNLNDTRKPGEQSSWTPETMPSGLLSTKEIGTDLLFKTKSGLTKYEGNVEFRHDDYDNRTEVSKQMFFPQGDVFSRARSVSKRENILLTNTNKLTLWQKSRKAFLELTPTMSFQKTNSLARGISFDFDRELSKKTVSQLIEGTYTGDQSALGVINRVLNRTKNKDRQYNLGLGYNTFWVLDGDNQLLLAGNIGFESRESKRWSQYAINYPQETTAGNQTYNRYSNTDPNNNLRWRNSLTYVRELPSGFQARLIYTIEYSHSHADRDYALLESVGGWGDVDEKPIGSLPSERELLLTIDPNNSYRQRFSSFSHVPTLMLSHQHAKQFDGGGYKVLETSLTMPLAITHDKLDYTRGSYDGTTKRNLVFFNPSIKLAYRTSTNINLTLDYGMTHAAPSMLYEIGVASTEDPLNIYRFGLNKLHTTTTHTAAMVFSRRLAKKEMMYALRANYNISLNSVAMGYVYDKVTGVRTYSPDNVSGNYTVSLGFDFSSPLNKKRTLTWSNALSLSGVHGVDLVGTEAGHGPQSSSVMTCWAKDRINVSYKATKSLRLGAKGYLAYGYSTSNRNGFDDVRVYDFHYGLTSLLTLPMQWQVSTDLTMYCRRGYVGAGLNCNDLLWNARISKTFAKAGLTLAVDGFDILGNLSNVSQVLNSQGRTEIWRNSLPRYVMAHVIYRFNKQPKKK